MFFKNKNNVLDIIKERRSVNNFDTSKSISKSDIEKIIEFATLAPTAFNLQNWHFTAVQSLETKTQLKDLAYGQQKVQDAAVTFVVSGLLEPEKQIKHSLHATAKKEILSKEIIDGWIGAVNSMYSENPIMQRDEAIRSASLASMNLMLAAQSMGLVSCPMIGFDANGVKETLDLPENAVPVMIIPVGFESEGNWPRKPRFNVSDVLNII